MRGRAWAGLTLAGFLGVLLQAWYFPAVAGAASPWTRAMGYRNEIVGVDVKSPNTQCAINGDDCILLAPWGRVGQQNNIWFAKKS